MLRFMYSGISGMKVNQNSLDVTGNNITNVSTTGFKASRAAFSDMLYQNSGVASAPTANKGGSNAKQVGLGAKLSSIDRVMSQGNALATGRTLDNCIDGEGFFMVASGPSDYTDAGGVLLDDDQGVKAGSAMTVRYTRDGNFKLDSDGNLITADGYKVLGYLLTATTKKTGAVTPIKSAPSSIDANGDVQYVDADENLKLAGSIDDSGADKTSTAVNKLQPLKIPDTIHVPEHKDKKNNTIAASDQKVSSFSIGKDGVVTAILADGSRSAIGQIAKSTFKNPEGLTAIGGNLYETSPNSGEEVVQTVINVDLDVKGAAISGSKKDNSKAYGDIIQGCLEGSNVDLTEQFTNMITATRSFQASSKLITTGDEILQTITGLMR